VKHWLLPLAGAGIALLVALGTNPAGMRNLRFHLGWYDRSAREAQIGETLKIFNRLFATFYATGGRLEGLNDFPAGQMVKRRVFQDIFTFTEQNAILVYDRDLFQLKKVRLPDPERAVALADEVWFLTLQESATRKAKGPSKANRLQVRYLLRAEQGVWRVVDFEVYGPDDVVPDALPRGF